MNTAFLSLSFFWWHANIGRKIYMIQQQVHICINHDCEVLHRTWKERLIVWKMQYSHKTKGLKTKAIALINWHNTDQCWKIASLSPPIIWVPGSHSLPSGAMGKRIRNVRKLVGWDRDKAKVAHSDRAKHHSLIPSHQQKGVQSFPGKPVQPE